MRTTALFLLTVGTAAAQQPPLTPPPNPNPTTLPKLGERRDYPKSIDGKSLPEWLKELTDKDPAVREIAIKVIPAFGPDAVLPATRPLVVRANDEDPGVRVNAIITLGSIGARTRDEAKPIVDALKLSINNAGVGSVVRLHATRALANYGILANDAIPTLTGIVSDPSWETRRTIAMVLGRIGQVPMPTAPPVKGSDKKPKEADMDKWTPSEKVLSILKSMMTNDVSASVRLEAVQSLVLLGPPDVPPDLYVEKVTPLYDAVTTRLKNEKDKSVLIWLVMLQMRLNGADLTDENIKKVQAYITDPSVGARVHALTAIGLMGEKARPALAAIIQALNSQEGIVVAAAITCLAALGDTAKTALPELVKLKNSTKDEILKALATEAADIIGGRKKK